MLPPLQRLSAAFLLQLLLQFCLLSTLQTVSTAAISLRPTASQNEVSLDFPGGQQCLSGFAGTSDPGWIRSGESVSAAEHCRTPLSAAQIQHLGQALAREESTGSWVVPRQLLGGPRGAEEPPRPTTSKTGLRIASERSSGGSSSTLLTRRTTLPVA